MSRKWSKDLIIQAIQSRAQAGKALNARSVQLDDSGLYQAARQYLGSWSEAVRQAGFDLYPVPECTWTKESIIAELQARKEQGLPLKVKDLLPEHRDFYQAVRAHFGSWRSALQAAGLAHPSYWTKERIAQALTKRVEAGLSIAPGQVMKENRPLYNACRNYFGSYREATKALGLPYERRRREPKWTKKRVVARLRQEAKPTGSIDVFSLPAQVGAMMVHFFGDLTSALEAAGFDENGKPLPKIKTKAKGNETSLGEAEVQKVGVDEVWTKELVLQLMQERLDAGKPVIGIAFHEDDPVLYSRVTRYFKSPIGALEALGIDFTGELTPNEFTQRQE